MGTKRKIEMEKRETTQQRSVACSKRRRTVFKKAADLCLHAGANVAVFVTSPAENSDVVYSFSGYSPASEIADCFLSGKLPPPHKIINNPHDKLGFWWEDPNLYNSCEDLSELNIIEDRLERIKKDILEYRLLKEEEEKGKQVDPFSNEIRGGESCSPMVSFDDQNSSDENYGGMSLQFDQNPNSSSIYGVSSSQIATFVQNPSSSLDNDCGVEISSQFDQNPSSSFLDKNYGGMSSQFDHQSPNSASINGAQIATFVQNPSSSDLDKNCGDEIFSQFVQNPYYSTSIYGGSNTLALI